MYRFNSPIYLFVFGCLVYNFSLVTGLGSSNYLSERLLCILLSLGIYISVSKVERNVFHSSTFALKVLTVLLVVLPAKIFIGGWILSRITNSYAEVSYLCATVVAQIDPIITDKLTLYRSPLSKNSSNLLRFWSSLDAPITTFIAFYILMPNLEDIDMSNSFNSWIYLETFTSCVLSVICFTIYFNLLRPNLHLSANVQMGIGILLAAFLIVYAAVSNNFMLAAIVGLYLKPMRSSKYFNNFKKLFSAISSALLFSSIFFVSSLMAHMSLDWYTSFLLALTVHLAHMLISGLLFFGWDSDSSVLDKLRILSGHQNGLTTLLLTLNIITLNPQIEDVLSLVLPTVIWTIIIYFFINSIVREKFRHS